MINFFSKYKIIFYLSNFALIFLYLFPGSFFGYVIYDDIKLQPQITRDFLISSNHFYAFFLLSVIGFFTYKNTNRSYLIIIYLVFLSIILETLHIIIPERSFELSDLFGNLIGVLVMIIINFINKKYENFKN
jgi:VanZ family protein